MKKIIFLLTFLTVVSCTHQTTIGFKNHNFTEIPKHVVWIQIPGLMYQHLVIRLFESPTPMNYSIWNKFECLGNSLAYNLYDIRPNEKSQTLTQITGNLNIKKNCDDYLNKPLWDYLKKLSYKSLIIEKNSNYTNTLLESKKCKKSSFLQNTSFLLMNKKFNYINDFKYFHYQTSKEILEIGKIYIDRTCQAFECVSSINDNLEKSWILNLKNNAKTFLLIRDFSYLKALKKKNLLDLKQSLFNLEKNIKYILEQRVKYPSLLLVLSTANGQRIEFPIKGKKWSSVYKNGRYGLFKNKSLYNNVFALGRRAENFCGMYNDGSIIDRFLWLNKEINHLKTLKNNILNND